MINKVLEYIDLSYDIENNMPVHPYDDPVSLYQDRTLKDDKYNNFRVEIGMHSGTHIDTPMHLTEDNTFINEIPLDKFVGRGCLLDVRNQSIISYQDKYHSMVEKDDIVLLYTGHSEKYWRDEYYTEYPVVDEELAEFFIEKRIRMLGMDLPSPDKYPFNIHKMLFREGILIIENLTNLSRVKEINNFKVVAIPLKIKAEASVARVFAEIYENC